MSTPPTVRPTPGGTGMKRIGSLFSGYGGLDMAVESVTGAHTVWCSDISPGPNAILAHHRPGVPNLGDISGIDWAAVEPVDIVTGGFPCQDVSMAGRRAGMGPGTRTGLWSVMCRAIDELRPSLVVAENVRGLLSAAADSDVEPCPWCLGDEPVEPAVRALGAVLGDLADIGYDAAWHGLSAAGVGAPHGRFRIFIVGWPAADADGVGHQRGRGARGRRIGSADGDLRPAADTDRIGRERNASTRPQSEQSEAGDDSAGTTPDAGVLGRGATGRDDGVRLTRLVTIAAADTGREHGIRRQPDPIGGGTGERSASGPHERHRQTATDWGVFGPAVRRWERILGRTAPPPTEPGPLSGQRLSPRFVEWMMGLPAGHVTDVPISRNEQLKALGNGVVPQQAAAALRILLPALAAPVNGLPVSSTPSGLTHPAPSTEEEGPADGETRDGVAHR